MKVMIVITNYLGRKVMLTLMEVWGTERLRRMSIRTYSVLKGYLLSSRGSEGVNGSASVASVWIRVTATWVSIIVRIGRLEILRHWVFIGSGSKGRVWFTSLFVSSSKLVRIYCLQGCWAIVSFSRRRLKLRHEGLRLLVTTCSFRNESCNISRVVGSRGSSSRREAFRTRVTRKTIGCLGYIMQWSCFPCFCFRQWFCNIKCGSDTLLLRRYDFDYLKGLKISRFRCCFSIMCLVMLKVMLVNVEGVIMETCDSE